MEIATKEIQNLYYGDCNKRDAESETKQFDRTT